MDSQVGYTGGKNTRPCYGTVCDGDGHAEALRLWYDPGQVSYEDLVDCFFTGHRLRSSPTQFRSVIWYHNDEQKQVAQKALEKRIVAHGVVKIAPARTFYIAEEYHQKYIEAAIG